MGDRISHIPDDLLLHILSSRSLQTKDVVATSLLSKRWRFLWHSIPKLEFHDMRFDRYESFLQFVDSTLNLVDLKSIKMFVVRCDHFMFDFEGSEEYYEVICGKVDCWLNTVLKSKLEFLNLWFARGFDFLIRVPLPSSIFKCSSIKILKLTRVSVSDLSDVNLPSLKTLELSSVDFSNPGSLTVLLSKCVRLEELFLMYLEFLDDEVTTLNIGKLPNLVIAYVPVELFSMEAFSNVTCLCFHEDNVFNDYEFPTFPTFYNLSYLEIDLSQNGWTSMFSCLPSFPKLETLKIREGGKGLDWSVETSPDIPPCISTHLKTFALYFFNYLQSEFEIVRFIMKNATVLRSLIIVTRSYSAKLVKRLYSSEEHETERLHLVEILSSYPKCSQNCCIFVDDAVKGVTHKMYGKLTSVRSDAECLFSYFGLW